MGTWDNIKNNKCIIKLKNMKNTSWESTKDLSAFCVSRCRLFSIIISENFYWNPNASKNLWKKYFLVHTHTTYVQTKYWNWFRPGWMDSNTLPIVLFYKMRKNLKTFDEKNTNDVCAFHVGRYTLYSRLLLLKKLVYTQMIPKIFIKITFKRLLKSQKQSK